MKAIETELQMTAKPHLRLFSRHKKGGPLAAIQKVCEGLLDIGELLNQLLSRPRCSAICDCFANSLDLLEGYQW